MDKKISISFTFTIPSFKKVYYDKKRRPYGNLTNRQQFVFLEDIFAKCICPTDYEYIDWVYEHHEDKRLHIHGFVIVLHSNIDKIYVLRDSFYTYNQKINMSYSSYLKVSDIQQTFYNISFWIDYIDKHQDTVVFKNGYTQQKELTESLDRGVIKSIEASDNDNKYRFKGKLILEI